MNLQNQLDFLPTLLDGVVVPAPLNADLVKGQIIMECGLLTPLYSEPYMMKAAIAQWFATHAWTFDHLVKIIQAEYSPIENVDRYDSTSRTIETSESETGSETGTLGALRAGSGGTLTARSASEDTNGSHVENRKTGQVSAKQEATSGGDQAGTSRQTAKSGGNDHESMREKAGGDERNTEDEFDRQKDTTGNTAGTDENVVSAFNSSAYQPANKSLGSESSSGTESESGSSTHSEAGESSESESLSERSSFSESESLSEMTSGTHSESMSASENIQFSESISGSESGHVASSASESGSSTHSESESQTTTNQTLDQHFGRTTDNFLQHMHGNIGVTTNQQMINQELDLLERFNVYGWIAKTFRADLILEVY